jgi:hypothetical protein
LLHPLGHLSRGSVRAAKRSSETRPDASDPCVRTLRTLYRTLRELSRTLRASIRTPPTHARTEGTGVRTGRVSFPAARVNARALRASTRAVRISARTVRMPARERAARVFEQIGGTPVDQAALAQFKSARPDIFFM